MTSPSVRSMLPDSSTSDASYNYPLMRKRLSTPSTKAAEQLKSELEAKELEVGVNCYKFLQQLVTAYFLIMLTLSLFIYLICLLFILAILGLEASIQWQGIT